MMNEWEREFRTSAIANGVMSPDYDLAERLCRRMPAHGVELSASEVATILVGNWS
jgi:hypothetical protein